jgi:hypothetical protein
VIWITDIGNFVGRIIRAARLVVPTERSLHMLAALAQNLLAISRQIDAFLNGETPGEAEDYGRLYAEFEDAVAELSEAMATS